MTRPLSGGSVPGAYADITGIVRTIESLPAHQPDSHLWREIVRDDADGVLVGGAVTVGDGEGVVADGEGERVFEGGWAVEGVAVL